jgi:hypothetical protein
MASWGESSSDDRWMVRMKMTWMRYRTFFCLPRQQWNIELVSLLYNIGGMEVACVRINSIFERMMSHVCMRIWTLWRSQERQPLGLAMCGITVLAIVQQGYTIACVG